MIQRTAISLAMAFLLSWNPPSWAGPTTVLGKKVSRAARVSMDKIDHAEWTALLQKYVDARGNVDYARWKRTSKDVSRLDSYLSLLSGAERTSSAPKASRLAFWINAYNAVTLRGILREYPTSSIRNHTARLYGYNIWKDLLLQVGDLQISLDDIEHQLLRKMGEPRIHFAIVCASQSCPKLTRQAYTADNLDRQLSRNAREFFADSRNFRYDRANDRFYLSSILKWFGEDFGPTTSQQLRAIAAYLPKHAVDAARSGKVRVSYLKYDWSLNDQARAKQE